MDACKLSSTRWVASRACADLPTPGTGTDSSRKASLAAMTALSKAVTHGSQLGVDSARTINRYRE